MKNLESGHESEEVEDQSKQPVKKEKIEEVKEKSKEEKKVVRSGVWLRMKERFGLDSSKKQPVEQTIVYDNSCGSMGLSTERDLIGNLLAPEEPSAEDEALTSQAKPLSAVSI